MHVETEVEKPPTTEPVFNTFRRKPLRPFYSLREFQIGLVILVILGSITGWVAWRGAHPDPTLFSIPPNLLTDRGKDIPVYKRPVEPWIEPGTATATKARLDPFPDTVISPGWRASAPPQMFDESNLYVKIDGREGFYKSYGFKKLHCLSLTSDGASIDLELFDLGKIENALGALAAEVSNPQTELRSETGGFSYATRNAGFLSQGRYYVRMLGSDDSELIRQKVAALREAFLAALPGATMPWSYALLVGRLRLSPASVQYAAVDAFSFEFATDVYSATLPGGEMEVFVTRRASADEAKTLAGKFVDGFAGFGKKLSSGLVQNDYTHAVDGARAHGIYVTGVRLAKSATDAEQWLDKLGRALDDR